MIQELHPSYFFDLGDFDHAELFRDCEFVWQAIARIENYLSQFALGKIEVEIPSSATLINPELISIGVGTVVEPGAYIRGPAIIGRDCEVRHGAYIRGNLIAGDGVVIGHTTEVKNTLLLDGATAAHFAYLGDCLIGNRVNLGAGTKCANLKLDGGNVMVRYRGQKINSGLRKFGAVIGDDSSVGCNSVPNPGTLLGKRVRAFACTNFGGFVPSASVIRSAQPEEIPL